jgi:hypothetical protein
MNQVEWDELIALKDAIDGYPQSVVPEHQERFTELFVKSLAGKGDLSLNDKSIGDQND